MDPSIRLAQPGDAAGIAAIHVAGWRDGCAGVIDDAYLAGLSVDDATDLWRARLEGSGSTVVRVATDRDGEVVGMVATGPADHPGERVGELTDLFVAATHRGTGVAGALHAAALDDLVAAGHRSAEVWVVTGNTRALRYYLRHGWVADETLRTAEHRGVRWRELRLGRDLD